MTPKPHTCSSCLLADTPGCTGFMPAPEGKGLIPLIVTAEALGENEARDSKPLRPYAESGSLFERALRSVGIQREQIIVTNIIKCRPPANRLAGEYYEQPAIEHCRQYFDAEVAQYKPKAILAMGAIPFKYLTGMSGHKQNLEYVRGYPVESIWYPGIPVIGTFHPSYIRRGASEMFPVLVHDLHKALQIAKGKLPWATAPEQVTYQLGGVAELKQMLDILRSQPDRLLAYDIETRESAKTNEDEYDSLSPNAEIELVQLSIAPTTGLAVYWNDETIPLLKEIFATINPKSAFNGWLFDNRVLEAKGLILNGELRDAMAAWHHLQPDLPANLQFVSSFYGMPRPWKHEMGADLVTYGIRDVDAVQRIESKINSDLAQMKIHDGYKNYVVGLRPILKAMEERGIGRDQQAIDELKLWIEQEKVRLNAEIQQLAPAEIKPVQRWTSWPLDLSEARKTWAEANPYIPISVKTGKPLKARIPVVKIEDLRLAVTQAMHPVGVGAHDMLATVERLGYKFHPTKQELCKELPFLPGSTQHLMAYLRHQGVAVPKDLDGKDTTGRSELDKLVKKLNRSTKPNEQEAATFINKVLEYRKLHKVLATYIEGWKNGPDGRIHTTFTFLPATGQLSSRNPNVQNVGKGSELAKRFRRTITPAPGHVLVEADYKSFHALTLGFEAQDPDYMRLARLDCHSFVAAHLLKLPEATSGKLIEMSDAEMLDFFKWFKSDPERKLIRDKKAKPSILGIGFGLGKHKLYTMNEDSFANEAEAGKVITLIRGIFPKVFEFQENVKQLAYRQGWLRSRWGFVRRFSDVYRYNSRSQGLTAGMDAEACIAFLPANSAFGKVREAMLDFEREGLNVRYNCVSSVHDSIIFDVPGTLIDEALPKIKEIMERPGSMLVDPVVAPNGLHCEVELSISDRSWADLQEVKV